MRYLSVCSGIEAATSAWHHLGWEPVAFSEIEPFPSAVLKHHYPNVPNWGDMTKYQTWPDATIDLLVGGTPCQSFSIAGLRKGLEDPRGNLMLTFLGIAQRYRPRYIVWENVPGVLSSNGGRDFGTFLAALGELGYGWAYRVLDAQWFGVAQRRRRVFVVGCLGDQQRAAQVLFECESVRRDTPPSRAKGQGAAADVAGSLGTRGNKSHTELDGHGAYVPHAADTWPHDIAGTLDAHYGEKLGLENQHIFNQRASRFVQSQFHAADTVTSKWAKGAEALQQGAQSGGNCIPVHAFKVRGGCEGGGKGYLGSDDTAFTVATHQDQHIAQPVAFRDPCPTLTAKMQGSSGWAPANEDAHLVGVTVATHQDQQIAQPIAVDVYNQKTTGDLVGVIREQHGTNMNAVLTPYVAQPVATFAKTHKPMSDTDPEGWSPIDAAPTVTHWPRDRSDGGTDVAVVQPVAQPVAGFLPKQGSRAEGIGYAEEQSPTLRAGCDSYGIIQPVAFSDVGATLKGGSGERGHPDPSDGNGHNIVAQPVVAPALTASNDPSRSPQSSEVTQQVTAVHSMTMQVRRLTPVECERLQGFRDNHTNIPWRGKAEAPDGPRYKALGNSMAVPVMRWIGERINA